MPVARGIVDVDALGHVIREVAGTDRSVDELPVDRDHVVVVGEEEIVEAPVGVREHQRSVAQLGEQSPAMRRRVAVAEFAHPVVDHVAEELLHARPRHVVRHADRRRDTDRRRAAAGTTMSASDGSSQKHACSRARVRIAGRASASEQPATWSPPRPRTDTSSSKQHRVLGDGIVRGEVALGMRDRRARRQLVVEPDLAPVHVEHGRDEAALLGRRRELGDHRRRLAVRLPCARGTADRRARPRHRSVRSSCASSDRPSVSLNHSGVMSAIVEGTFTM